MKNKYKNFWLNHQWQRPDGAVLALYFFLIAGGRWHLLHVFQTLMRWLAAPILIGIGIWIFLTWQNKVAPMPLNWQNLKLRRTGWSLLVVVSSFWIEGWGVRCGCIFGKYHYGDTLQPLVAGVPIAIGFAWLVMLLSAAAILQRWHQRRNWRQDLLGALQVATLMVIFDAVMEPAATKLGYWTWEAGIIPGQNYLAGFQIASF
ncbi:carotenoid biosynthesis protein [candidate division KSB1 bacterium]|nr:carotenoid biosynthesis protein [candidate division KSB1 bacterium]